MKKLLLVLLLLPVITFGQTEKLKQNLIKKSIVDQKNKHYIYKHQHADGRATIRNFFLLKRSVNRKGKIEE